MGRDLRQVVLPLSEQKRPALPREATREGGGRCCASGRMGRPRGPPHHKRGARGLLEYLIPARKRNWPRQRPASRPQRRKTTTTTPQKQLQSSHLSHDTNKWRRWRWQCESERERER